MELVNHRKWKFPRSSSTPNSIFPRWFLLITITSITILSCNSNGRIQCSPTKNSREASKTPAPEAKANTTDTLTAAASENQKPSRLDANESELVQIDEGQSTSTHGAGQPSDFERSSANLAALHDTTETFQANDLMNLLDLQQRQHQQQIQNMENRLDYEQALSSSRRLARSINQALSDHEYHMNEDDGDTFGAEFANESRDQFEAAPNELSQVSGISEGDQQREASQAQEADLVNKLALEDQVRKQDQIQSAQAQHIARVIQDQQAALTKQHNILLKQQLDDALDDSENDRQWRRSLTEEKPSEFTGAGSGADSEDGKLDSSSSGLSSSISGEDGVLVSKNENAPSYSFDIDDIDDSNAPMRASSNSLSHVDLATAAQHHNYGSHYGSLHKHQGKYYQSVESHKKGQYKSAFKRGNKKFMISGHANQDKHHASGHVKWHSKKGKGSHHWEYKHKGKKGHHYHK